MFPVFKLVGTHVKFTIFYFTQANIAAPYPEFAFGKTHGLATIATPSALVKHQGAMHFL